MLPWPSATGWPDVRVACVWLPELPLRVEVLRNPKLADRPLVVGGGPGQRHVVGLCSAAAARMGIRPGLPLREVLPLCPNAVILPPDPVRTAGVLDAVAGALERVGPTVEVDGEALFIDLRGLARLYRNDLANLERAMRRAVPSLLLPRFGAAAGKLTARIAAQTAGGSTSTDAPAWPVGDGAPMHDGPDDAAVSMHDRPAADADRHGRLRPIHPPAAARPYQRLPGMAVVEPGFTSAFLAPLPIELLPLAPDQHEWLRRLGLRTVGQLAALPLGAVQAQLGPAGARAWYLAHGRDDEPVVPRRAVPTVRAAMRFDDPLASIDAVFFALDQLLAHAYADTLLRARSARQCRLGALLIDGSAWERLITFKEPLASAESASRALKHRLNASNAMPPAPIEELVVDLRELDAVMGHQSNLFASQARAQDFLVETVERLRARYGGVPIYRASPVEPWSRLPENRWVLVPLQAKHQNINTSAS